MTDVVRLWLADQLLAALAGATEEISTEELAVEVGPIGTGAIATEDDVYPILLRLMHAGLVDGRLTPRRRRNGHGLVVVWERPRRSTRFRIV